MRDPEHVEPPIAADAVQAELLALAAQLTPEGRVDLLKLARSVLALEQAFADPTPEREARLAQLQSALSQLDTGRQQT